MNEDYITQGQRILSQSETTVSKNALVISEIEACFVQNLDVSIKAIDGEGGRLEVRFVVVGIF